MFKRRQLCASLPNLDNEFQRGEVLQRATLPPSLLHHFISNLHFKQTLPRLSSKSTKHPPKQYTRFHFRDLLSITQNTFLPSSTSHLIRNQIEHSSSQPLTISATTPAIPYPHLFCPFQRAPKHHTSQISQSSLFADYPFCTKLLLSVLCAPPYLSSLVSPSFK